MKKLKLVLSVLLVAVCLVLCSCGHEHIWSQQWSHDDDFHWHDATCGDTLEVDSKAPHQMRDFVCSVCGYTDWGTVHIDDVVAWTNCVGTDFFPIFSHPSVAEKLQFECSSNLQIDADKLTCSVVGDFVGEETVVAKSAHFSATFKVTCRNGRDAHADEPSFWPDRTQEVIARCKNVTANTTLFVGDSFMDEAKWSNFHKFDGTGFGDIYDAVISGIGGTAAFYWENKFDEIFNSFTVAPKNIVWHIGINNFLAYGCSAEEVEDSVERLFLKLHQKFPQTEIWFFGITPGNNSPYEEVVSETNSAIMQWCAQREYVNYVPTPQILTGSMLEDGLHPKVESYAFMTTELALCGCQFVRR